MEYILGFIVALIFSAIFSGFETAYVSTTRLRASIWLKGRVRSFMVERPEMVLITDLLGTNLSNVSAAIILTVFFMYQGAPPEKAAILSGTITTVSVLFFGEILPKSIGRAYPLFFVRRLSPLIYFFHIAFWPLSRFLEFFTTVGRKEKEGKSSVKREFEKLIEKATEEGGITEKEGLLFTQALHLLETPSESLMIPREKMVAISLTLPKEELIEAAKNAPSDRILVYGDDLDNIFGLLHIKDLYFVRERKEPLESVLRPVIFSYRDWTIGRVLHELRKSQSTHVVVVDEHGVTLGVLTLEFILGRLFNSLTSLESKEKDEWELPGGIRLVDLERIGFPKTETEAESLAGLIIEHLGRIPTPGEEVEIGSFSLKILDADEKSIKRVLLKSRRKKE